MSSGRLMRNSDGRLLRNAAGRLLRHRVSVNNFTCWGGALSATVPMVTSGDQQQGTLSLTPPPTDFWTYDAQGYDVVHTIQIDITYFISFGTCLANVQDMIQAYDGETMVGHGTLHVQYMGPPSAIAFNSLFAYDTDWFASSHSIYEAGNHELAAVLTI